MDQIKDFITVLGKCIPDLDTAPLNANAPESAAQGDVLEWLYEHLSEQGLMAYEEWSEYTGYIPELKSLEKVTFTDEPSAYIFSLIEDIDWSTAELDPYELPYILPWLEHINAYLQLQGLRLINLLPFENAYIMCVRNDEHVLQELETHLEKFEMGINMRDAMDQQQVSAELKSLLTGE